MRVIGKGRWKRGTFDWVLNNRLFFYIKTQGKIARKVITIKDRKNISENRNDISKG